MATKPAEKLAKPRFYHKDGKIYDAGVELSDNDTKRILTEYPEKMKKNEEAGKDFEPAAKMAKFANETLAKDMKEVQQAIVDRDMAKALKKPAK